MERLESQSDGELLQLSLAGDESAFRLLYERLKGGIFRYAFYMTNSQSAAEEVIQEVFITLLKEGKNYRSERGNVAAFAFGIARNFVRRIERRERAYQPLPGNGSGESMPQVLTQEADALPGQMIRDQMVQRVLASIASLPDHYRQVIVLCDLCEFSYAEAAARLQCPVGTIRSRLNRGHAILAQKLNPLRSRQPEIGAAGTEGCVV